MIKRCVAGLGLLVLFLSVGLALPATVNAIDGGAKKKFEKTVNSTGGSEATALPALIKNTINILLYVAGVIAVVIIVVGSLRFVTSEGDAQAANKAKNSVVYALVGLVLAVLAYAIVNFVLNGL